MEKKELYEQVAKVVEDLFNDKEEAKIRERTEAELQKAASSISDLTSALEEKNAEVVEYEEKVSESTSRIQELESELEAAKTGLETANEKFSTSEQALEDMKKDRAAELRIAELEDAGVARSDRDSQINKVREMTEEDFASYKDELVSIREAVVAELKNTRKQVDADAKAEEEAAEEAAKTEAEEKKEEKAEKAEEKKEEEASEEEKETTEPAEITPGQAAMASLNMEYMPSEDLMGKYAKLGEAMAKRWKNSDE